MTEPVSLDDIKQHLVLDPDDISEDLRLSSMITAARHACELRMNRSVIGGAAALVFDGFPRQSPHTGFLPNPSGEAHLPDHSQIALTGGTVLSYQISYFDHAGTNQTMADGDTHANLLQLPGIVRPATVWPTTARRPDAVTVNYVLSPLDPDKLEMVRHAIRLLVGHWYANRETVADTRGTPGELPMTVAWLLDPLRVWAI
jgi:hypothetical protein